MISVIIPSFNRLAMLIDLLKSLEKQTFKGFEVIIVDDFSTEFSFQTLKTVLNSFSENLSSSIGNIKLIQNPKNYGRSITRNAGIENASFNNLVFIDNDCIAHFRLLENYFNFFKTAKNEVGYGILIYGDESHKPMFPERIVSNARKNMVWPYAANFGLKKTLLQQINTFFGHCFDPKIKSNEDIDLILSIAEFKLKNAEDKAFEPKYLPQAKVYHQLEFWTAKNILKSTVNSLDWLIIKEKFSNSESLYTYKVLNSHFKFGILDPFDYLYLLFSPVLVPVLFVRYIVRICLNKNHPFGKTFKPLVFFSKHPLFFLKKRFEIWNFKFFKFK